MSGEGKLPPSVEYSRLHLASGPASPAELEVTGTVTGLAPGAQLLVRARGGGPEYRSPAAVAGGTFRAVLDLAYLVRAAPGVSVWDLYLTDPAGGPARRIEAPYPDLPARHRALRYPTRTLRCGVGTRLVGPYVTLDGRLSVASRPGPAAAADAPPERLRPRPTPRLPAPAWLRRAVGRSRRTARRQSAHARRAAAFWLVRALARPTPPASRQLGDRPKIYFLLQHAFGLGGTIRTTFTVAGQLAADYDVELVSVLREREQPFFPFPPGTAVTVLEDRTRASDTPPAGLARWLRRSGSVLIHRRDASWRASSLSTDVALLRWLRSRPPSVLVTTRPSLNLISARYAPPGVVRIGQDHQHFSAYPAALAKAIARYYPALDRLTVLSRSDEREYAELIGNVSRVVRIPNALPALPVLPRPQPAARAASSPAPRRPVVIAAGRLTAQKGFDRLIDAFAVVAAAEPEWTLRIYGGGPDMAALRERIVERELYNSVFLMGASDQLAQEMAQASLFALSSRYEGFGMVIIEAMSQGLGVVSFDCPNGPAEILTSGVDGLLVPNGDVPAFAAALLTLIRDADLRGRLADAALITVQRYRPEVIGRQWRELLAGVGAVAPV